MIQVESTPVAGIYIRKKNGETVYFAVRYYSSWTEGSFEVVFEVQ
jgi:hypothetical protein